MTKRESKLDVCCTCKNDIPEGEGRYFDQCMECHSIDVVNVKRKKAHKKIIPYPIKEAKA